MLVGLLARELRQPDRSVPLSPPPPPPGSYLLFDSGDLPGPGLALFSAAPSGLLDPTGQCLRPPITYRIPSFLLFSPSRGAVRGMSMSSSCSLRAVSSLTTALKTA